MAKSLEFFFLWCNISRPRGTIRPSEVAKPQTSYKHKHFNSCCLCFAACRATVDVAFIVDSSGSIGRSRWPKMLNFLKDIIKAFNVGPDGTHVAVVAYSTRPVLEFTFNAVTGADITSEEYGKRIDRIRFQRGFTYIDKALKMADEQVFVTSAGMRPAVPKVYLPSSLSGI